MVLLLVVTKISLFVFGMLEAVALVPGIAYISALEFLRFSY